MTFFFAQKLDFINIGQNCLESSGHLKCFTSRLSSLSSLRPPPQNMNFAIVTRPAGLGAIFKLDTEE